MTDLVTPASDDTRAGLDMGTYEVPEPGWASRPRSWRAAPKLSTLPG